MVAHLLRLRLDLLLGAARPGARRLVAAIVRTLGVAVLTAAICVGVLSLGTAPTDVAAAVTVVGGAAITAGALLLPLWGGGADQLAPRRFRVFAPAPRPLAGGLLLAGILSVPVLALLAVVASAVAMWIGRGAPAAAAVTAGLLGFAGCFLLSRIGLAWGARLRAEGAEERLGPALLAATVVAAPAAVVIAATLVQRRVPEGLELLVPVLARTPLGAAWALPVSDDALVPAVIAAVTVGALTVLWFWVVDRALTTVERPAATGTTARLGWFAVLPASVTGAVAARSLLYWLRDPRYLVNLVIIPIAAVVTVFPLLLVGVPLAWAVLLPAPIVAIFLGWLAHNDLAYDGSALWLHIASGVRGAADRFGRLVPPLLLGVPTLAVIIPVTAAVHGAAESLPVLIGVCAVLFLGGLGLSSVFSVVTPYPASGPEDGPFQQPQRTSGGFAQAAALLGALVVAGPVIFWGVRALIDSPQLVWRVFWGGIGLGVLLLVVGVVVGGLVFDRRGSRLMDFAASM